MAPDLASVLLSALIGAALGIFGGGGSILAVPVLVFVTQLAPAAAVGTSQAMVGATSLIASYAHHRRGLVKPKLALLFGLSGVVTAFLGARLTAFASGSLLMHAFAAVMLVVGVGMLFGKGRAVAATGEARRGEPRLTAAVMAGAGVGLVTGFLGVGGGFLIVPALTAFTDLDVREAIGTSLLVIAINSAAGFVGHLGGGHLDLGLIAGLTASAVAGAALGERVARGVPALKLRRGFGLLVVAIGIAVVVAGGLGGHAA
jgi:uncharacterized membrane protein YfcA